MIGNMRNNKERKGALIYGEKDELIKEQREVHIMTKGE